MKACQNTVMSLKFVLMSMAALLVAACSGSDDEKVEVQGERLSVITTEGDIAVDPVLSEVLLALPRPYVNPNWGQAGGNPTNVVHHPQIGDVLSIAWRRDIGVGSKNYERLASGPIVWDGVVYVIDVRAQVSAFNASNGSLIWRTELDDPDERSDVGYGGGVAYWGGRIFATTGYGFAVALDASTGQELWRSDIGVPLRGAPSVADGRVFVNTHDNQLYALDADTGAQLWDHFAIVENAEVLGASSPGIFENTVVAAFSSGEVFALRAQNGQINWQDALSRTGRLTALATLNDVDGNPVIYDGRVYVGNHSGRLVAIDMRSGERIWDVNIGTLYTPWIAGDYMYVLNTSGELINLSTRDGRVRWITQLQRFEKPEKRKDLIRWAGPVLAGDRLFVVSSHGYILTLSPYTGEILSGDELPGATVIPPIVANQTLYVLTEEGDLVAYR